ncbi:MAG: hypothetical protein HQL80_09205 [Magnetococcales bacterium]|nr:hypothetical protein [Magnetococcales bacterium]MBF0584396.1 hypothetical protein [Magnetococcales bacterium]
MTIRRVDRSDKVAARPSVANNNLATGSVAGEIFARQLAEVSGANEPEAVAVVQAVQFEPGANGTDPNRRQRREQLDKADELLDSLVALGNDLVQSAIGSGNLEMARERLRETRDHALRTLSSVPEKGEERDLLHRTAVLATVELAKTDRGDYK